MGGEGGRPRGWLGNLNRDRRGDRGEGRGNLLISMELYTYVYRLTTARIRRGLESCCLLRGPELKSGILRPWRCVREVGSRDQAGGS